MNPRKIIVGFDLKRTFKEYSVTINLKLAKKLRRGRLKSCKGNAFNHCKEVASRPNGVFANWYRRKHGIKERSSVFNSGKI